MKAKARLQGFTQLDEDEDEERHEGPSRHFPLTYEGICNTSNEATDNTNFCPLRPSKCLHGIYDKGNLARNVRLLDQYYQ